MSTLIEEELARFLFILFYFLGDTEHILELVRCVSCCLKYKLGVKDGWEFFSI